MDNPTISRTLPFHYVATITLLTGASNVASIQFDTSSAFEWHQLYATSTLDAATDFSPNNFSLMMINDAGGNNLSTARVPQRLISSPSNKSFWLPRPVMILPGSSIKIDALDISGGSSTQTVTVSLFGYKLFDFIG